MALPDELVSQLVKIVGARGSGNTDYSVYGTIVESGGQQYVRFDGSDINTPFESTVEVSENDRVIVEVKGHTATVTGNTSNPSFGKKTANGFQSLIEQNANNIEFAVEEIGKTKASIEELPASIVSKVENELIKDASGNNKFTKLEQTINGFTFTDNEGKVWISNGSINLTGKITFNDFTTDAKDQLSQVGVNALSAAAAAKEASDSAAAALSSASSASGSASSASSSATAASKSASNASKSASNASDYETSAWEAAYDSSISASNSANAARNMINKLSDYGSDLDTVIDGRYIQTGTLFVDQIHLGNWMAVYRNLNAKKSDGTFDDSSNNLGGYFGWTNGFNSTYGLGMQAGPNGTMGQVVCTNQAARLSYGSTASFVASSTGYVNIDGSTIVFELGGTEIVCIANHTTYYALRPCGESPLIYLGQTSNRWAAVYATNGTIQTSDRNYKHDIETIPDKYITMFDNLVPRRFKMNEGSSGRYHIGYIAQEVEEAMSKAGIDSLEFGGFVRGDDGEGKEICMLRYDEFDAIRDAKIKQLEARLAAIEERI